MPERISELGAASAALVAMELAVNDAGTSRKITIDQIRTLFDDMGLPRVRRLNSQHSNSSTTPTKVTELDMTIEAGTYLFEYTLLVRAATGGVAPVFNFNFTGTGAPRWWYQYADLSATLLAAIGQAAHDVTTQSLGFQMAQAEATEATTAAGNMGPAGGLQSTATDTMVKITGIVVVTVTGNLELWHGSETATATTVEVGSSLIVHRTA